MSLYNVTVAYKKIKRHASSAQKSAQKKFDKVKTEKDKLKVWTKLTKSRLEGFKKVTQKKNILYKQLYLNQIKINSKKERFEALQKQLQIAKKEDTEIDKNKKIQNEVSNVIYLLMSYKLQIKLFGNNINAITPKDLKESKDPKKGSIGEIAKNQRVIKNNMDVIAKNQKDIEKIKIAYKTRKENLIGMIEEDRKKNLELYKKNDRLEGAIQRAKGDYDKYLKKLEKDGAKNLKNMFEVLQKFSVTGAEVAASAGTFACKVMAVRF